MTPQTSQAQSPRYVAKIVRVAGAPVGNLWDIYDNNDNDNEGCEPKLIARVTYHGDTLVALKGTCNKKVAHEAIDKIYTDLGILE